MHECMCKLLGDYENLEEENVEALCKPMSTIGNMIDKPKAKEKEHPCEGCHETSRPCGGFYNSAYEKQCIKRLNALAMSCTHVGGLRIVNNSIDPRRRPFGESRCAQIKGCMQVLTRFGARRCKQ